MILIVMVSEIKVVLR